MDDCAYVSKEGLQDIVKRGVVYTGEANAIINKHLNTKLDETIKYSGLILEVE